MKVSKLNIQSPRGEVTVVELSNASGENETLGVERYSCHHCSDKEGQDAQRNLLNTKILLLTTLRTALLGKTSGRFANRIALGTCP